MYFKKYVRTMLAPDSGSGTGGEEAPESAEEDSGEKAPAEPESQNEEKPFTATEAAKLFNDLLADYSKKQQNATSEAEKLKNMSNQEQAAYRIEQMQKRLEDFEAKEARANLSKEAARQLSEESITADDEVLNLVVRDSAEATSEMVKALASVVKAEREAVVRGKYTGKAPAANKAGGQGYTKEDIMKIEDKAKREKAIAENMHLFKK
ncbi:DUF4355 domain-containing protein [Listeria monocytogenes]|nr:DUF4355 domain-containing protein [Listeria monocytogenes]